VKAKAPTLPPETAVEAQRAPAAPRSPGAQAGQKDGQARSGRPARGRGGGEGGDHAADIARMQREGPAQLVGTRDRYVRKPEELIPMLQTIQKSLGYLPEYALLDLARLTRMPAAAVFGVATFYEQFRMTPGGRHTVRLCRGTACHVRGAERILNDVESAYRVKPGETTDDGSFTLETVACFGSCALAPVVVVDGAVKGRMTPAKTCRALEDLIEPAAMPDPESPAS
jgi:NADH-quinone oxidoreductase subunit E